MFDTLTGQIAWIYYAITIITTISIIIVVVSENRNPVKSLAWITVLVTLPMVGIILYLFFGRSIKNKRMISRRNRRRLKQNEPPQNVRIDRQGLTAESIHMVRLAKSLSGARYYPGNDVTIFSNGQDKFDALLSDIAAAKKHINLQYYIFENDNIGERVAEALIERARAGVTVRLIYDHVGSFHVRNRFFHSLTEAGVQAYPFFKVSFPQLGTRVNWRNHRKICIIDGAIGYIGGMNVADRYITGGDRFAMWRDLHLRITGPAVNALSHSFAVDWNFMGQDLITDSTTPDRTSNRSDNAGMQLLTSGPTDQWTNISFLFLKAITNARKRVYIYTPYFLPTSGLLKALQTAALSGVDVRILIPRRSDSAMLTAASFSYVAESLQSGIKMYLFEPGMMHAKALLVDDEFVSVGSTNFDFRSFEHNFEANMQIYSKAVNARLADLFLADLRHSTRIHADQWRKRPWHRKAIQSLTRLLSPVL